MADISRALTNRLRSRSEPVTGTGQTSAELHPLTLRFGDRALEAEFRERSYRLNVNNVRLAYLLAAGLWILWGFLIRDYLGDYLAFDLSVRYGFQIPLSVFGLAFSRTRYFRRFMPETSTVLLFLTGITWIGYVAVVRAMPADYGYVGVILIMTFGFTLLRLPFLLSGSASALLILLYVFIGMSTQGLGAATATIATFYLLSFWVLGLIAAYGLDRSARLLFLRERQLDTERVRSDALLLNVLPQAIVERLKATGQEAGTSRIAEGIDEVTVLFADAVGFTPEAVRTPPEALVGALDELFSRFDGFVERLGLEKIKTVGDNYFVVGGAPTPLADHAGAVAEMAISIQDAVRDQRWPSGEPIRMRIGIATGPVVAGVIGRRKFAYDMWGDTVNLASRLESQGEPGRILVSEETAKRLEGRFWLSPVTVLDLKGRGPTRARFLLGRL
jgi:class 3 adenylate cyclase